MNSLIKELYESTLLLIQEEVEYNPNWRLYTTFFLKYIVNKISPILWVCPESCHGLRNELVSKNFNSFIFYVDSPGHASCTRIYLWIRESLGYAIRFKELGFNWKYYLFFVCQIANFYGLPFWELCDFALRSDSRGRLQHE